MIKKPIIIFPEKQKAELQYREIKHPGVGELLVKKHKSLISIGTELTAYSGDYPEGSAWESFFPYPFDAGYATAGEVIEVEPHAGQSWILHRSAVFSRGIFLESMSNI